MRTFGLLKKQLAAFTSNGSRLATAQNYANVIKPCLLQHEDHEFVIHKLPPPPLHMMIGGTDVIMSVIIKLKGSAEANRK